MENYYSQQVNLPHFASYGRQRGSGIGAFAAGIGRIAMPFAKKLLLPAAKKIGKELILQSLPEIAEIATKRKSPKAAMKSAVRKTIRKQMGAGRYRRKSKSRRRIIRKKNGKKRSRSQFFSRVNNVV